VNEGISSGEFMSSAKHIDHQTHADLQKKEAVRVIIEALGQAFPVSAAIATILRFSHPSELQKALETQRMELINSSVDHERRLHALEEFIRSRLDISYRALSVGRAASRASTGQFREQLQLSSLKSEADLTEQEWDEAIVEFESKKLAYIDRATMQLTWRAFCLFDPLFLKTDPVSDAAAVADVVANCFITPNFSRVLETTKIPVRRLNPALEFLSAATDGAVRRTINGEWVFLGDEWTARHRYRFRDVQENSVQIAIDLMRRSDA
jgi:hypothetical protein